MLTNIECMMKNYLGQTNCQNKFSILKSFLVIVFG